MIDSELLEITWIAAFLLKKVTAISHTQKWKSVWKKDNKRKDYFECFKLDFTVCLETTVTRFFSVSRSYQSTKSPWVNPASHPFTMSCNFSVHNPGMNILYPSSHIQCWQDLVYTWFVWLELQYEAWKGKTMPVHNISKKWECMAEEDLHLSTRKNVHWLDQCPALVMKCLLPENKQHKTLYFSIIMCKNILLCEDLTCYAPIILYVYLCKCHSFHNCMLCLLFDFRLAENKIQLLWKLHDTSKRFNKDNNSCILFNVIFLLC